MCHAVKRLFCGMGVHPAVHELDLDPRGRDLERALARLVGAGGAAAAAVPVLGEVLLEERDLVAHLHHGRPRRRRVLRAREPDVDQLRHDVVAHGGAVRRRRRGGVRQPRPRHHGGDVVRVVSPDPVVQREALVEDDVSWPLPGDQLEYHHSEAVHVTLCRWMPS
jgi:hypothetical protein